MANKPKKVIYHYGKNSTKKQYDEEYANDFEFEDNRQLELQKQADRTILKSLKNHKTAK